MFVHGVGFCATATERIIVAGAGLVWCPSSNQFLFGATTDVRAFDDADRLALGSDSRLSGERDLLDEIAVAYGTRQLSAEGIARTVMPPIENSAMCFTHTSRSHVAGPNIFCSGAGIGRAASRHWLCRLPTHRLTFGSVGGSCMSMDPN